jgi:hypothetical protein
MPQSSQIGHVQRPFRYVPAFFMNSCVKSTPFWPEEKYYFNNNNYINFVYVFHFSSLVSVFRNAGWFGIAGSQYHHTTPHCILDTQNCCFFVLSGTHITPNSLSFLCILCFASSLLGLPMEKICHSHCVVWGWRTLPLSYIRYLNNESLNCLSDNSEQAVIKTHLFRMVRPRMRKNSFFICLHVYLLLGYSSSYHQVSTHTAYVS